MRHLGIIKQIKHIRASKLSFYLIWIAKSLECTSFSDWTWIPLELVCWTLTYLQHVWFPQLPLFFITICFLSVSVILQKGYTWTRLLTKHHSACMVISFTCVVSTRLIRIRLFFAVFIKRNVKEVNRKKKIHYFVKGILCSLLERKEQNRIILIF